MGLNWVQTIRALLVVLRMHLLRAREAELVPLDFVLGCEVTMSVPLTGLKEIAAYEGVSSTREVHPDSVSVKSRWV